MALQLLSVTKPFWVPGKASGAGAARTPCHLATELRLTLDASMPRTWALGSRGQGWMPAPGHTIRYSPSDTHLAPLFSRS